MNQWMFIGRVLLAGAGIVAIFAGGFIFTAADLPPMQRFAMAIALLVPLGVQVAFAIVLMRRGRNLHPPED